MPAIKIDADKLRAKLEERKNSRSGAPKLTDILKINEPGKYSFRAVMDPHSSDPEAEPFPSRWYHYGLGKKTVVYCPQKNQNKTCHICELVWSKIRENKEKGGPKEVTKEWAKSLPKLRMFVPGLLRNSEEEGPKFFGISTQDDKPSKNHLSLYEWLMNPDTNTMLDPEEGYDIELTYTELDPAKKSFLKNAKVELAKMDLARRPSKFGKKGEYEQFVAKIKNIDDVYPVVSSDETLEILSEWQKGLTEEANKKVSSQPASSDTSDNEGSDTESASSRLDDLQNKIAKHLGS